MYDGRLEEAATLQEEAASIMRYNDDLFGLTVPLRSLALLATYQCQYQRALSYCREALTILRPLKETGWSPTAGDRRHREVFNGNCAEATQLLGAAERLRRRAGRASPKDRVGDHASMLQTLRTNLSDEDFSRLWEAEHAALSDEEAIAAAMEAHALTRSVNH